jgi:formylglycine-generating enzyme required for sulfatase activity
VDSPDAPLQAGAKYYQLTHDYLVPSLRDWLTRKQKETPRGRAELLLADRAAMWNARPENRQLPSLLEWLKIRCLTQKKNWTPPQRRMMGKATQHYMVRELVILVIAVALALFAWAGYEGHGRLQAQALRDRLHNANTNEVPTIVQDMANYRRWLDPVLQKDQQAAQATNDARRQLHASLALLPVDATQVDYLYDRLLDAEPDEVPVIRDALAPHQGELLDKLWAVAETPAPGKQKQRLRAAATLAKYQPDGQNWAKVQDAIAHDLAGVPDVYLASWMDGLRPVRAKLIGPLSSVYRNPSRRDAERSLARDILADYARDQPLVLVDLLMDADAKQFAILFPKAKEFGDRSVIDLLVELEKQAAAIKYETIFEKKAMIVEGDAKVETQSGSLPAKRFDIHLEGGKTYRLTMDSDDLDSYLLLQDRTGLELAFDDDSGGNLNALLLYTPASTDTYKVYAASLMKTGSFVLKVAMTPDGAKDRLAKRQANLAVALLRMNRPEKVWPLLKHSPDPQTRSYLIHRFGPLGADARAIVKRLDGESDVTIRRALILSLGEFYEEALSTEERKAVTTKLQDIYCTDADPGLHAAAEWLLRSWQHRAWLKQINDGWAKDSERQEKRLSEIKQMVAKEKEKTPPQWYVNGQGQTMVVIPGPVEFVMGSSPTEVGRQAYEPQHKKRIDRTFAVAAKSVTMEQYRQFEKLPPLPPIFTRTADLPVVATSWHKAAAYCNWLSDKEGIDPKEWCYEIEGEVATLRENYLSLSGYRLPTEAEMEYATRASAVTSRYFGEAEELLPKYAWYAKNSQEKTWPVGSLKPNDLGLFDVHGNVFTWCQESYKPYPATNAEEAAEDKEDALEISQTQPRVVRGGAYADPASLVRSASRNNFVPTSRIANTGFRVARTFRVPLREL